MSDVPLDPALREEPYPFQRHLGFVMTGWDRDVAVYELPVAPHLGNRRGHLQGGVPASVLDTAMGHAGCYTGDPDRQRHCVTLSLNVNYLARAEGARLIATGRRTGGGRKTFFAEGVLEDETGARIATATGVFRYITLPPEESEP